ncbi:MAG: tRNA (adenosine(37)-N6)-dimethylallyltransferase MiaA [Desulfobulbaceae bacterium]|nr:tRNA (adenosine(37)-N6)-dimethylallyltransferase MiaA [Desulfobulbaceae bacterium]
MTKPQVITSPIIVLAGPTAIGKTALSLKIAQEFNCGIISMDSMQVYRYMDIGTAKPTREEQALVPHYLIDLVDPDDQYQAARFVDDALLAIQEICWNERIPLLTGGTGLYLSALLNGLFKTIPVPKIMKEELRERLEREGREELYRELSTVDPEAASRVHANDTHRLLRALEVYHTTGEPWSVHLNRQAKLEKTVTFTNMLQIGLTCDRDLLYQRIEQRSRQMLETGLVQEVQKLLDMGYDANLNSMQSIGYRHVNNYLAGEWNMVTTGKMLVRDTRRYAKRQMTWFFKNKNLDWHQRTEHDKILSKISKLVKVQ